MTNTKINSITETNDSCNEIQHKTSAVWRSKIIHHANQQSIGYVTIGLTTG